MYAFPNAFSFLVLLWVTSYAWNPVPFEPSDDASSWIRSQLRQQRFGKISCRFMGSLGKDLAHLVHTKTIQKLSTKSWDSHYPCIGFPLLQLVDSNLLRVLGPSFSRYVPSEDNGGRKRTLIEMEKMCALKKCALWQTTSLWNKNYTSHSPAWIILRH